MKGKVPRPGGKIYFLGRFVVSFFDAILLFIMNYIFPHKRRRRADRARSQCLSAVRLLTFFANGESKTRLD